MKSEHYTMLRRLSETTAKEYGKHVQQLLGIALLEAGATQLKTRAIQGMDLEFDWGGKPHACEVKTCEAESIKLGSKDIKALCDCEENDVIPLLAVLGGRMLDDLMLLRFVPDELAASTAYPLTQLRAYRDRAMETLVLPHFENAVVQHAYRAITGGQAALNRILETHDQYRQA